MRRDCLLKGKGASIVSGIYNRKGHFYNKEKSHSTVECGKPLRDMYYAPRRKTIQTFELLDMIAVDLSGIFSETDVNKYFASRFNSLLLAVSLNWYWAGNDGSEYYGQKPVRITVREMFSNLSAAYHDTKAHLKEKGFFTKAKQKIMYYCMLKMFIYISIKLSAKKILKPLGIWRILQYLKHKR